MAGKEGSAAKSPTKKSPKKSVKKSPKKSPKASPMKKSPAKMAAKSPVKKAAKSPAKKVTKSPIKKVAKSPAKSPADKKTKPKTSKRNSAGGGAAAETGTKRKLNSYMKFAQMNRPSVVKSKPHLSAKEVMSELGAKWRKLSEADKAKFKWYTYAAHFSWKSFLSSSDL